MSATPTDITALSATDETQQPQPGTPPPYGPDYPHWMNLRVYGVTTGGAANDLPLPDRKPGLCPVEGCHCMDEADAP